MGRTKIEFAAVPVGGKFWDLDGDLCMRVGVRFRNREEIKTVEQATDDPFKSIRLDAVILEPADNEVEGIRRQAGWMVQLSPRECVVVETVND